MTTEAATIGLTHGRSEDTGLGHRGPESKSIVVPYGFWLFVLSDMVLFSALFASYGTLVNATDGGPTTHQLFPATWLRSRRSPCCCRASSAAWR